MYEIPPKKKFGQNFLTDQSIVEKIILSAGDLENKSIIEIGGGSGNLTKHLLKAKPKKLLVIEIDRDYSENLSKILENTSIETKLISEDILNTDIYSFFPPDKAPSEQPRERIPKIYKVKKTSLDVFTGPARIDITKKGF